MNHHSQRQFKEIWFKSLTKLEMNPYYIPKLTVLKKLYRTLGLKYHPDKCDDCSDRMEEINNANDFLKKNYDEGVRLHKHVLSEAFNDAMPLLGDQDITGKEDHISQFLSDFGIPL